MMRDMTSRTMRKRVYIGRFVVCAGGKHEIHRKKGKTFIFEINDNRLIAASEQERKKGHFTRIDRMETPDEEPVPKAGRLGFGIWRRMIKRWEGAFSKRSIRNDGVLRRVMRV
jgi:hypothetical protein